MAQRIKETLFNIVRSKYVNISGFTYRNSLYKVYMCVLSENIIIYKYITVLFLIYHRLDVHIKRVLAC